MVALIACIGRFMYKDLDIFHVVVKRRGGNESKEKAYGMAIN